ncbi:hypothetical protein OS493_040028, partial [Desmophyllum pertusum]
CARGLGSGADLTQRAAFRAAEWLSKQPRQTRYLRGGANGEWLCIPRSETGWSTLWMQGGGILNAEIIKKGGVVPSLVGPLAVI